LIAGVRQAVTEVALRPILDLVLRIFQPVTRLIIIVVLARLRFQRLDPLTQIVAVEVAAGLGGPVLLAAHVVGLLLQPVAECVRVSLIWKILPGVRQAIAERGLIPLVGDLNPRGIVRLSTPVRKIVAKRSLTKVAGIALRLRQGSRRRLRLLNPGLLLLLQLLAKLSTADVPAGLSRRPRLRSGLRPLLRFLNPLL
jgi:hypothetical protein